MTSIGADHVIDYSQDAFANGLQRHDLILGIAGNSPLPRLRRALTHVERWSSSAGKTATAGQE
jgi:hypothetical protein